VKIKKESDGNCLNCQANLQVDDQFCPRCGQKVDRNDLRLKVVISEFFENYLSFDSRLGRTLIPFFFKPGFLSEQFINGVRRNYANPFRLYIFSSLFFFFCLNGNLNKNEDWGNVIDVSGMSIRSFDDVPKPVFKEMEPKLSDKIIESLNQTETRSFKKALFQQKGIYQKQILAALPDSIIQKLQINKDSILKERSVEFNLAEDQNELSIDFDLQKIRPYLQDPQYTNEMLYDSLAMGKNVDFWEEVMLRRMIRLERANDKEVSRFILSNLSLAMFVLVPLFALLLKLFYFRRNKFYVAHLIHTIYLQSFAFVLFGVIAFLRWFEWIGEDLFSLLLKICALLFAVYFIASFKRIYQQSWFKLLTKSLLLMMGYLLLSVLVLLAEIVVSFLLF
jgi:hypothetical protein